MSLNYFLLFLDELFHKWGKNFTCRELELLPKIYLSH